MKKQTFCKYIKYPVVGRMEWQEIQGYSVVILGFEEFSFFVHKGSSFFEEGWHISEESTGFGLPEELDASTRQKAIDNASRFLKEKGKDKFINALSKAREIVAIGGKG